MSKPPYIISQSEYWKCPIHVMTGLTWLFVGMAIGWVLAYLVLF